MTIESFLNKISNPAILKFFALWIQQIDVKMLNYGKLERLDKIEIKRLVVLKTYSKKASKRLQNAIEKKFTHRNDIFSIVRVTDYGYITLYEDIWNSVRPIKGITMAKFPKVSASTPITTGHSKI